MSSEICRILPGTGLARLAVVNAEPAAPRSVVELAFDLDAKVGRGAELASQHIIPEIVNINQLTTTSGGRRRIWARLDTDIAQPRTNPHLSSCPMHDVAQLTAASTGPGRHCYIGFVAPASSTSGSPICLSRATCPEIGCVFRYTLMIEGAPVVKTNLIGSGSAIFTRES